MSTTEVTPVPETSPAYDPQVPAVLTSEQKAAFNSGKSDIVKPKAAPAPAKEPSDRGDEPDKAAAASEPAKGQERKKTQTADERKAQLQREIQDLTAERNRLRSERTTPDVKREAAPSPAVQPKVEAVKKPTLEDKNADGTAKFKTFGEYEDARDKWNRDEAIREFRETSAKEAAERAKKDQEEALSKGWQERVEKFNAQEPDFARVLDPNLPIHSKIVQGSVIEGFMLDSEQGPQLLYHLEQNPVELDKLLAIKNPFTLTRELWKIEQTFSAKEEKKAPAPQVTKAPKPVSEVGGRGTAAPDPLEAELKANPGKLTRAAKQEADRQYAARFR